MDGWRIASRAPSGQSAGGQYARRSPGRGQRILANCPVPESVMYAVVRSSPPQQMLVVKGSGVATKSTSPPAGDTTLIPLAPIVATQMLPAESTPSESK